MIGLTPRQAQLLRFITGYAEAHGRAPSYAEIRIGLGLAESSNGAVVGLVRALVERGALRKPRCHPGKGRQMQVVRPLAIPRAPDGAPLFLVQPEIPT